MTDNALEQIITRFLLEMRFCQRLCDSKFFEAKTVLADKAIMKGIYMDMLVDIEVVKWNYRVLRQLKLWQYNFDKH